MHQWLRFIQVLQQKEGGSAEAEQNGQVIRGDIAGQRHVWVSGRPSTRGVKWNVGRSILIPSLQTPGLKVCVPPRGKPTNPLRFSSLGLFKVFAMTCSCGRPIARIRMRKVLSSPSVTCPERRVTDGHSLTSQPLPTTSTHSHTHSQASTSATRFPPKSQSK